MTGLETVLKGPVVGDDVAGSVVRGIAVHHAVSQETLGATLTLPDDPTDLVPAAPFAAAVAVLSEARQRELGRGYARLWARTFRPLVRHLRGRPVDAVRLFVDEVYPYLRGEPRAARLESLDRRSAALLLEGGLPDAYLAGMVEGFLETARAQAHCEVRGGERFHLTFQVRRADQAAWLGAQVATLRVPFLVAAATAAVLGLGLAAAAGHGDWWRATAALVAVLAVQGGANALHHLRTRRPRGPLAPPEPPGVWFRILMTTGYLVGTGLGVWLALETPALLGVGAAGLGLSFLYSRLRARGLGPLVAALTYGPLITVGALHAMVGYQDGALHGTALAASLPLAVFAAALFYVNDLADRGLDEATGKRTLLVRLPRADHAAGFAVLVTAGAATALGLLAWLGARGIAWLLLLGVSVAAGWLIVAVRRHVDDPAGLAAARFGTLALHAATGALLLAATYLEAA